MKDGRRRQNRADKLPRLVINEQDVMERSIRAIQTLVACFPQAAAALVGMVVNEGRAFAEQGEGKRLMRELSESEWVERGRILWEACGLDALLTDTPSGSHQVLASTWIRCMRDDLTRSNMEKTLSKMMLP